MSPFRYGVSGFVVESVLPLRGLVPVDDDGRPPEYTVSRLDEAVRNSQPEWPRQPSGPRDFIRKSGREPDAWWLRTEDARTHRVHPSTGLVEFDAGSSPGLALTHSVVDFALPNLLSCGERVVLHGALLETQTGCVAALGESGVGKSTLAARWVRSGRRFLSDDWFVLRREGERLIAYPSHPSIRLRARDLELAARGGVEETDSPSAFSKVWYAFPPGSAVYGSEPRELRGVALLRRPGNGTGLARTVPLGSRDAMTGLVSALVLLEIDSAERWRTLLPLLARVEAGVRMEEVWLPEGADDEAGARDVMAAIEGLARDGAGERTSPFATAGKGADARGR